VILSRSERPGVEGSIRTTRLSPAEATGLTRAATSMSIRVSTIIIVFVFPGGAPAGGYGTLPHHKD